MIWIALEGTQYALHAKITSVKSPLVRSTLKVLPVTTDAVFLIERACEFFVNSSGKAAQPLLHFGAALRRERAKPLQRF